MVWLARVDDCYCIIKRAYLNPAIHLVFEIFSKVRVITLISSENGGMNNSPGGNPIILGRLRSIPLGKVIAFPALPAGYRNNNGNYNNMGNNGYFWSSTENNSNNAWNRKLNYNNSEVNRNNNNKKNGFTVRDLKSNTALFSLSKFTLNKLM